MNRYRRRHQEDHHENLDRWLISYADYMTLMFAVFVVLYALAIIEEERFRTLSETLGEMFHLEGYDEMGVKGDGLLTQQQRDENLSLYGEGLREQRGSKLLDAEQVSFNLEKAQVGTPLSSLEEMLHDTLLDIEEQGFAQVNIDENWITIDLSSALLFTSGSAFTTANAVQVLSSIGTTLKQSNNYIRVRGYTDNLPINNEMFQSNWQLSVARAMAVLQELEKNIDPRRLAVEGYGPYQPLADNQTEEGRARNRRVVIAISRFAWKEQE